MENKLTVDRALLDAAYQSATDEQRVLEGIFSRDAFHMPWQDDLKRACNDLKLNYEFVLPYGLPGDKEAEVLNAYAALRILAKWVRGDWEPDWSNGEEPKYRPIFTTKDGLKATGTYICYQYPSIGETHFPKEQMALDFARKYLDLYNIILTN